MQATIITIGDEIVIGQILDSNAAFIAQELNKIGVDVKQIHSIQDNAIDITKAVKQAEKTSQIIIITGGLGPTKDDITKKTLCTYFEDEMKFYPEIDKHVKAIFKKYNLKYIAINRYQAEVPSKAQVLFNDYGTAPGMWFEKEDTVIISLPGVPFEMKNLITSKVIPKLQKKYKRPHIIHKTIITYGKGESELADDIALWENHLPNFIKLAYLPSYGRVRLRLSGRHQDKKVLTNALEKVTKTLLPLIKENFIGFGEVKLVDQLKTLLNQENAKLAVAESFTGGKLAGELTSISGSSSYFVGSVTSYATRIKKDILNVPKALIDKYSVVSQEVAEAMALGVQKLMQTEYAIATTGNAGPTKGDANAEVGTAIIAIASPNGVKSYIYDFGQPREKVVNKAINEAINLLIKEIQKKV
jgi:nicotinamide-nucleotide amidase